jgi:hypothetical protein
LEVASSLGRLEGHARQALAPGGLLRALAENATHDPVPGVRKRNLRHLVERYPSSDETRRAAEGAEGDADPEMRLLAAVSLGGERASGVLLALARDSGVRSDLRVEAVERLRAARHPAVFEVARDVAPDADAALAQAAARALAELGDARAEPILIQLLGHESLEARSAAAEALGKLGTVRAVEPLLPLTKGLTTSAALKDAARAAVRAIQGRLGVVEAGRVSLTEEEAHAGALSIASEGGEVSLAPPEEVAAEPGAGRERTRGAGKGPG